MKKLILSGLTLCLILGLNGCNSTPEDNLKDSLDEYSDCLRNNDFKCVAEFTDSKLVESMGGINSFKEAMKASGINISEIDIKKIKPIEKNGNMFSSKIAYIESVKINGQNMKLKGSMIATSKDGKNWFFTNQQ